MARAALEWTTAELGARAGVGANIVNRFEAGHDVRVGDVDKIRRALEATGVEFLAENDGGAGARLRRTSPTPIQNQADLSLDREIAAKETAIAEMSHPPGPSPEAAIATMDKALAEKELIDMKNKQTRRKTSRRH